MSIFYKDCPHCATAVPVTAVKCACGFSFEPSRIEQAAQRLELAANEEQLYENYLAARVAQLEEAFVNALTVLAREPENDAKKGQVEQAKIAVEQACTELAGQTERLARASKEIQALKVAICKSRKMEGEHQAAKARYAAQSPHGRSVSTTRSPAFAKSNGAREETETSRASMMIMKAVQKTVRNNCLPPVNGKFDDKVRTKLNGQAMLREIPSTAFKAAQAAKADRVPSRKTSSYNTVICPNCMAKVQADALCLACGYQLLPLPSRRSIQISAVLRATKADPF